MTCIRICWISEDGTPENCLRLPCSPPRLPPGLKPIDSSDEPSTPSGNTGGGKPGGSSGKLMPMDKKQEIYPQFLADALTVGAMHHAVGSVTDEEAAAALRSGIKSALAALEKRTAKKLSLTLEED